MNEFKTRDGINYCPICYEGTVFPSYYNSWRCSRCNAWGYLTSAVTASTTFVPDKKKEPQVLDNK